jgi:hypothetical protein
VRFVDSEFQPLSDIDIAVDGNGRGTRNVWIEVKAAADDTSLDEGRVDEIPVHVTSDSDQAGTTIISVETTVNSRIFRSQQPVTLCIRGGDGAP